MVRVVQIDIYTIPFFQAYKEKRNKEERKKKRINRITTTRTMFDRPSDIVRRG